MSGRACLAVAAACVLGGVSAHGEFATAFEEASPVWTDGNVELNQNVGFRGDFEAKVGDRVLIRLTGVTVYRAFVNGEFAGYGPARAARGFFRIDEYDVSKLVRTGTNALAIEVPGYNVPSYYQVKQPPFLGDLEWAEGAMALPGSSAVRVRVAKGANGKMSVDVTAPDEIKVLR